MKPLHRAQLVDSVAYASERAAFFGRECWVAMRMGQVDRAQVMAEIAFRWAVQAGFYREEN